MERALFRGFPRILQHSRFSRRTIAWRSSPPLHLVCRQWPLRPRRPLSFPHRRSLAPLVTSSHLDSPPMATPASASTPPPSLVFPSLVSSPLRRVAMAGLSDFNFQAGLDFEALVKRRFGSTVAPVSASTGFHLVLSFSRASIKINQESAALILQSCIGGKAEDFRVLWLKDWCFRFTVASKAVGFMVYQHKKISGPLFDLHFALWQNGGPNFEREKQIWDQMQDAEWQLVTR